MSCPCHEHEMLMHVMNELVFSSFAAREPTVHRQFDLTIVDEIGNR